ncbi:MAG: 5,6-dimethylbenzimidazole synthase [Planctomycetota bacterium]
MGESAVRAIYDVIHRRRDVRQGFLPDPVPEGTLARLLEAAHAAPSVGFMQPWRFIVLRDDARRARLHDSFKRIQREAAAQYDDARAEAYLALKLEALREAPLILAVTCEVDAERGHGLGRTTWPEMAQYSTVCAIQNLWLAARAEGIGVGWVSILERAVVRDVLELPDGVEPTAILTVGYVDSFGDQPELERLGWEQRVARSEIAVVDRYDGPPA